MTRSRIEKLRFPDFPPKASHSCAHLKKNNDREWFTPRKPIFEETVRQPMIELVGAIHREMLRFAPEYVGEPAKCVYRIYRDTRFSKDKTPYKTYASALAAAQRLRQVCGQRGLLFRGFAGKYRSRRRHLHAGPGRPAGRSPIHCGQTTSNSARRSKTAK